MRTIVSKAGAALALALGIAVMGGSIIGGIALAADRGSDHPPTVSDSSATTEPGTATPAAEMGDDSISPAGTAGDDDSDDHSSKTATDDDSDDDRTAPATNGTDDTPTTASHDDDHSDDDN